MLLKNADATLPSAPTTRRIAVIGPTAEHGQAQGGGSAVVRPEHRRGPLDALSARGYEVTLATGGVIAKFLPPIEGMFHITFFDATGRTATTAASRLKWYWDEPHDGFDGPTFGGEGALVGHRWNDCNHVDPLSPFGHGLGYTTFRIEPTAVAGSPEEGVIVSVGVTNTGTRAGSELVQVYVEPTESAERRPVRALAALARITLAAGANGSISIELAPRSFSHWTPNGFVIPADLFSVLVGDSSRSLTTAGTVSRDRR